MSDLSLVSTDELKAELEKRFDIGVVLMNRSRTAGLAEVDFRYWGDTFSVVGILRAAQVRIEREASDIFGETEDDES